MEKWLTLITDLCVIIFDLALYFQLTVLRKNEIRSRRILFTGCIVIVACYLLAVYVFNWPTALAAFVCMTLPSLALFWSMCRYRDARFFLTFCFVDTVTLIIGYLTRCVGLALGELGSVLCIAVLLPTFIWIYRKGKPHFQWYREALEIIDRGWKLLTFSAALIYVTLIFCAAYPTPLMERPDYILPYLVISAMVVSFYVVFLVNIAVTKKVFKQSIRLQEQQKWFHAAYIDALTEIPNRAAYIKKIHEVERMEDQTAPVAILIMDLDRFKKINDAHGHSVGDEALRRAAKRLTDCFCDECCTAYRIGGDEFAVIAVGLEEDALRERLLALGEAQGGEVPFSISAGYSFLDRRENNAVDQAFARADAMMYARKTEKEKMKSEK